MTPAPYRVIWKRSAIEIQLATIVVTLFEQGKPTEPVTRALALLEEQLARDPQIVGESRPHFERVATESPVTIWFAVHEEERLVYVLAVSYSVPRHQRD
jgi:hypothetical protein